MLFTPWTSYDADAQAWIQAVEKADGQHLELEVRRAMNQLVLDMKSNSLWTPTGTMVVKMGARTLAGALIDIKNPSSSWTNTNFVSGDYSRIYGLTGNSSTKYLDSGRNNNTDAQNDQAMWTFVNSLSTNDSRYMGVGTTGTGSSNIRRNSATATLNFSRAGTGDSDAGANALGLIGMSRAASGSFTSRGGQADQSNTRTSTTPTSGSVYEYATNLSGSPNQYADHRSCAAAIGAAITLSTMETVLNTFIDTIDLYFAVIQGGDADAAAWINAVEVADGQVLEVGVKNAMNQLVTDLKTNSIWADIGTMAVLMGARTLAGSIIDIKNPYKSWTSTSFVSGDYNRTTGLLGNGSSKYLNSNSANGVRNDASMWVVAHTIATGVPDAYVGISNNTDSTYLYRSSASVLGMICQDATGATPASSHAVGFMGISRSVVGSYVWRANATGATITRNSITPTAGSSYVFAQNSIYDGLPIDHSNARLRAAQIGTAHDLATAETCITTYIDAIIALGL